MTSQQLAVKIEELAQAAREIDLDISSCLFALAGATITGEARNYSAVMAPVTRRLHAELRALRHGVTQ